MTKKKNNHPQQKNHQLTEQQFFAAKYSSGPLPPPEILQKYDAILPGLADRIVNQAEKQTDHRIELEKKVVSSDIFNSKLGLVFGFFIGMAGIVGGLMLAYQGLSTEGYVFSGVSFVSLVSVFIYGTRSRRKERESRRVQ